MFGAVHVFRLLKPKQERKASFFLPLFSGIVFADTAIFAEDSVTFCNNFLQGSKALQLKVFVYGRFDNKRVNTCKRCVSSRLKLIATDCSDDRLRPVPVSADSLC